MNKVKYAFSLVILGLIGFVGGKWIADYQIEGPPPTLATVQSDLVVGQKLPSVAGTAHDGSKVSLEALIRAKEAYWTIIPIFSTGCGKCLGEAIEWKGLVERFEAVEVIGLTPESGSTELDPFVEATDDKVAFLTVDSIVPLKLGVQVFPTILVADSSSIVVEVESGRAATEQIESWLNGRGSHRQEAKGDPTSF